MNASHRLQPCADFRHCSFVRFRQRVFGTHDPIPSVLHFNDSIGQISRPDMFECRAEEFSLTNRRDIRNKNDHSGMQRFAFMKRKKIRTIVRYKRVVLLSDGGYELPVFRATETEIIDMVCCVTRRVRQFNQGGMQALVDQQLHCRSATARLCRLTRISFRLAQGREAGRPRRGNACT